jgi:hypothetical protein
LHLRGGKSLLTIFCLKIQARLPGCLENVETGLAPALEVQNAARVGEMDIVRDAVMTAVMAAPGLLEWKFC